MITIIKYRAPWYIRFMCSVFGHKIIDNGALEKDELAQELFRSFSMTFKPTSFCKRCHLTQKGISYDS